jgi:hypothetical protein
MNVLEIPAEERREFEASRRETRPPIEFLVWLSGEVWYAGRDLRMFA